MRDDKERKPPERHGLSNTKLYHRRYQVTVVRNGFHFYLGTYADENTAKSARNEFLKYYMRGDLDNCWFIRSVKRYVA